MLLVSVDMWLDRACTHFLPMRRWPGFAAPSPAWISAHAD
jgi:hypothetical protein